MNRKSVVSIALVVVLSLTCAVLAVDSDNVDAATGATVDSASGTIGSGVNWEFDGTTLKITAGSSGTKTIATGLDSDSSSKGSKGWGSTWALSSVTLPSDEDSDETTTKATTGGGSSSTDTKVDKDDYSPADIFGTGTFAVSIQVGISIADGAFTNIRASSVFFTTTSTTSTTTIGEGAFEKCTTLTTANLDHVTSVGTDAFNGCSSLKTVSNADELTTIASGAFADTSITSFTSPAKYSAGSFRNCDDLTTVSIGMSTSVDQTAFQGCTKLATINVSETNTVYKAKGGLIYTNNYATMYMCPPAKTGTISSIESATSVVYLDYANVDYIINLDNQNSGDVEFKTLTGANASGIAYSTQSLSKVSSAAVSGTTFTLSYTLYNGWTVNTTVATIEDGNTKVSPTTATNTSLSFTVQNGHGYMVYPVGYASITEDDLRDVKEIEGWSVTISSGLAVDKDDDGRVTNIRNYSCSITGYTGSDTDAVLRSVLYNGGAACTVTSMASGNYGAITTLDVEGEMEFSDALFANCYNLRSVTMKDADFISDRMFRYCVDLVSVDIGSCTSIGEYAFEGCSSLADITLGSKEISIGKGAFSNCSSLEMLKVGIDTKVNGNPGIFLVHCDEDIDLNLYGENLILSGSYSSVSYSETATDKGQSTSFYRGGIASIYVGGMDEIYLEPTKGNAGSKCLIVFDTRLGFGIDSMVVDYGGKISDLPTPSRDGYTFLGWTYNGSEVSENTTVSTSMVLTAEWQKENSPNNASTYVLLVFVVAVLATIAVLFVNSRR